MKKEKQKNKIIFIKKILVISFLSFFVISCVDASSMSSTSFIIRDPVVGAGGEYGTSSNFKMFGSSDTLFTDAASSASFGEHIGFLYYPYVVTGTLTATPVGSRIDLSWPASTAGLGWTAAEYYTGKSSVSGGPYTYTSVGNSTNYSYPDLLPGNYCFVVQTIDSLGNVIGTSNESCATVVQTISFSISAHSLNFGALSSTGPRYANTTTGSGTDVVAHTMTAMSNATSGYVITYMGPTLTSNGNTIAPASSISGNGTAGTPQFGMSFGTTGSATIPVAYRQSGPTRSFVANTTTTVASTSGVTASETFDAHYLANISSTTSAGTYNTSVTYIMTANF